MYSRDPLAQQTKLGERPVCVCLEGRERERERELYRYYGVSLLSTMLVGWLPQSTCMMKKKSVRTQSTVDGLHVKISS